MGDWSRPLREVLTDAAEQLLTAHLPPAVAAEFVRLAGELDQPCTLAVVGRVNAGKSTFVNALLGSELSKVGCTETTATVTCFRYGQPLDPARPVRCHRRSGRVTDESPAFLAGLQENDPEALRRAEDVTRLEFLLPHPFLRDVTLIDTPGTAAVVQEHQTRTDEFFGFRKPLAERNEALTDDTARTADAVVYLVGEIARATDEAFLTEFGRASATGGARAMNAAGVLAKVDRDPAILARRHALAEKIAGQLRDGLNTIVPVSAGVQRALDRLLADGGGGLNRLAAAAGRIPAACWDQFLASEELFRDLERPDCPVAPAEREELLADLPWTVFTTIVRELLACGYDPARAAPRLEEVAGFRQLKEVLDRHFFRRSRFLRAWGAVGRARTLLNRLRRESLAAAEDHAHRERDRWERFRAFLRSAGGDRAVAAELEGYVGDGLGGVSVGRTRKLLDALERKLADVSRDLEHHGADFEQLEVLDAHPAAFTGAEADELRALLGQHGLEPEQRVPAGRLEFGHLAGRQRYWLDAATLGREAVRRSVADRAAARYGLLLEARPRPAAG